LIGAIQGSVWIHKGFTSQQTRRLQEQSKSQEEEKFRLREAVRIAVVSHVTLYLLHCTRLPLVLDYVLDYVRDRSLV
jgi:hypothetical protein